MKKSLVVLLSVLFLLSVVSPAFGAVKVEVSGKQYQPLVPPTFEKGMLLSPLALIAKTLGAAVTQTGKEITVTENENVLKMTLGSTQATFNGNAITLPQAPKVVNGVIMVPFRAVYELFGAKLAYQPKTQTVSLNYQETRNDMTAVQMMVYADEKQKAFKSYKMACNMDMIMNTMNGKTKVGPVTTKAIVDASIQQDPIAMYLKEVLNMSGLPTNNGQITVEVVFNDKGMFMSMPGAGWIKMPFEGAELNKMMQESMKKDSAASTNELIKSGAVIVYGNDQTKDGQDYWVIEVTMGPDAASEQIKKSMDMMPSLKKDPNYAKAVKNTKMDMSYKVLINKQTMLIDYMMLNCSMSSSYAAKGVGTIAYSYIIKADYKLFDYNVPVTVPEIKGAKNFEDYLAETLEKSLQSN